MPIPSEQYAFLAHKIYGPLTLDSEINSDNRTYRVRYISPQSSTNYRGAVLQDQTTGKLIVVNKGTEPSSIHDIIADAGMGTMGAPTQWPEAATTVRWALRHAEDMGIPVSDISITGHSLGGALAQLQAALPEAAGVHAETFNAYGALHMARVLSRHQSLDVSSAQDRVINHRMYHDPVSAAADPIGQIVNYMDHRDYQNHKEGGLPLLGEARAIAASHGIGNFWDQERNQPGAVFAHNYMLDLNHRLLDDLPRGVPLDLSVPWHMLGQQDRAPVPPYAATVSANAVDGPNPYAARPMMRDMPVPPAPLAARDPYDSRQLDAESHALYCTLQERIPDASKDRLLEFTAACREHDITARTVDDIYLDEERMTITFHGKDWVSTPAVVDLTSPPPEPEQSIRQLQQIDQQQMQIAREIAQELAQSAQMSMGRSL